MGHKIETRNFFDHNIIKAISEYLLPNKIKYVIIKFEESAYWVVM